MEALTTDNFQRVRIPDAKPGQVFAYELFDNVIKLTQVASVEEDVSVVKMVRHPDGTYSFPKGVQISREEIRRYLRADRDAR